MKTWRSTRLLKAIARAERMWREADMGGLPFPTRCLRYIRVHRLWAEYDAEKRNPTFAREVAA